MNWQTSHIEYTNLITKGQEVERLVPYIGKNNVIGYLFDYNIPVRKAICNKITGASRLMHTSDGKKCLYFSFIVSGLKSCRFPGVKKAMESHPIAGVIYNTVKAFDAVASIECNRFYYTRLPKGKSEFEEADFFPVGTDSNEPSARMARGEFGQMLAAQRKETVNCLDNCYGYKFASESDYKYALHIDFKVFFDFSDKVTLAMFLKNSKWSGAFVTILDWATRNQDVHRAAWRKSEEWFINYSEYHCSRNDPWWDIDLVNEMPFRLARPKTYEFWRDALWHELRDAGYTFDGSVIRDPSGNVLDEYGNVTDENSGENADGSLVSNNEIKENNAVSAASPSDTYTIENWYRFINGKIRVKKIRQTSGKRAAVYRGADNANGSVKAEPP